MLFVILMAALLAAEPAVSDPAPGAPPPAVDDLKPGERRVKMKCKAEALNGSRVIKRRCMSVEDWKRQEEESAEAYGRMQNGYSLPPTCRQSGQQPC